MTKHLISVYVSNLEAGADTAGLIETFKAFIASRDWICPAVWAVDQRGRDGDRNLGLNLALPDDDRSGWFGDVETVVSFCDRLHRDLGHDFVLGNTDRQSGCGEDILEIDAAPVDLDYLRRFIGAPA